LVLRFSADIGKSKELNRNLKSDIRARTLSAAVLVLALVCLRIESGAQIYTWRGRELDQRWRKAALKIGPLRLQPALVLANAGIDSNIYYSPSEPVKDFTVTAGPRLEGWLPIWRRLIIYGSGSPQYVYYSKTARERTWNYYYSGAVALSLRRLFINAEGRYSDARERWNYEIDIRPRRQERTWAGNFLIQTSRRTSLEFNVRRTDYDYENLYFDVFNVRERLNRTEIAYGLTAYYQKTSRTKFFLAGEQQEFDFEFAETSALKDSRSRAGYAGLEFSPIGRIRGQARVGWKELDVFNAGAVDYGGIVGDVRLSLRLAGPFWVRASYLRDVDFSVWYDSAYYIQSRPSLGASLYVLRFIRLDYDYSIGRNDYPETQDVGGGVEVKRRDDYHIHQAGVYFRIRKNVALGAVFSRWLRDSNLDREDDKRYFYGLNLTYDF